MSWHWDDPTIGSDGAPIVTSDPTNLASHVFDAEATQHVFYRAGDGHIIELWWGGPEAPHWGDLIGASGGTAPLAAGDPTSHVFAAEGTQHVFYRTGDGSIIELWWRGGEFPHWGYPMRARGAFPPPSAGDLTSHVFDAEGTQHVFYRGGDGHIIELWWRGSEAAHPEDLTVQSGGAPLAAGDPTSHVFDAEGTQHVFYTSVDFQIIELWWRRGEAKHFENLTVRSRGAPLAAGDPTSHVFAAEGTQHVFYNSAPDTHIIELQWGAASFHHGVTYCSAAAGRRTRRASRPVTSSTPRAAPSRSSTQGMTWTSDNSGGEATSLLIPRTLWSRAAGRRARWATRPVTSSPPRAPSTSSTPRVRGISSNSGGRRTNLPIHEEAVCGQVSAYELKYFFKCITPGTCQDKVLHVFDNAAQRAPLSQ